MKLMHIVAGVVVSTAAFVAVNTTSAGATGETCKIEPVIKITDLFDTGHNFEYKTVDGVKTVTGKFKVTGGENCTKEASLAVWIMPTADGQPLESQIFFDSDNNGGQPFGPGVHTLTAEIPGSDCYFQVDMLEGKNPKGFNGTANYGNLMHPIDNTDPLDPGHRRNMLDADKGGTDNVCEDPETPETPEEPETPEVKAVQTSTPTQLPSTGAGAIATTFLGVSTSAGLAHAIVRRFLRK